MVQEADHDDLMMMMMRKGPWTEQEDDQLVYVVNMFGDRRWDFIAKVSGLKRSGKSCRLRWVNYLNPALKRGKMTPHEERQILELHTKWGNRWSKIARKLPGRTDNEIKNYWRTYTRKMAQKNKRVLSPSPSVSNNSSTYSSITTVDSIPITETTERSFYDTGGLEMVTSTNDENKNRKTKNTATSVYCEIEGQDAYNNYLMDEIIWKDITDLLDDEHSGITRSVFGTYNNGMIAPSSIWDYPIINSSLWMIDGQMEIGSNNMFLPQISELAHCG